MVAPAVADCGASSTFHVPAPPPASETTTSCDFSAPWFPFRSPNESEPGSEKRSGWSALSTLMRPAPSSVTGASCVFAVFPHAGPAVVMSADLICWGVQLGCSSTSSATAPVTCGADMLVPSKTENWDGSSAFVTEERMSPPGADTSGFNWWPKAVGPAEEKKVTTPSRSVWIWRMAVSMRICPRPWEPASAVLSRCPSRSEIIPDGTAISTGMPLGVPARLFTITSPIPPASFTRAAFETKLQKPRETSAIEPVSEPAGSGLYAPFGSSGRPQRCWSTGVPSRPTIVPMSVSCCALNAHVLGMLGAIARWKGIACGMPGRLGESSVSVGVKTCLFVTAATVIASGAVPGLPSEPRPKSSRSLPAEMTGTTPACTTLVTVSIIASFAGSVCGPPPEKLITSIPSRTAASNASTISGVFAL